MGQIMDNAAVKPGRVLSRLRQDGDISQRELAQALGISQPLLCQYETGARTPGLELLCRACDYFGVTMDYLAGRTDRAEAPVPEECGLTEGERELKRTLARLDIPELDALARDFDDAAARLLLSVIEDDLESHTLAGSGLLRAELDIQHLLFNTKD